MLMWLLHRCSCADIHKASFLLNLTTGNCPMIAIIITIILSNLAAGLDLVLKQINYISC